MFEINKFGEKFANFNNKSTNKFSTISGIKQIEFVSGPMLVSVEKELQSFEALLPFICLITIGLVDGG